MLLHALDAGDGLGQLLGFFLIVLVGNGSLERNDALLYRDLNILQIRVGGQLLVHLAVETFIVHIGHRAVFAGLLAGLAAGLVLRAHLARLIAGRSGGRLARLARLTHLARLALRVSRCRTRLGQGYGRGQTEHEKDCQQMLLHSWFLPVTKGFGFGSALHERAARDRALPACVGGTRRMLGARNSRRGATGHVRPEQTCAFARAARRAPSFR